jgi:hypothetical protein
VSTDNNEELRSAREATPSGWFPGRAMTRSELAQLVVEHVWRHHGIESPLDRKYIAKLETGRIRYPTARYRQALRDILGARSDAELGFVSANRARVAKDLEHDLRYRPARRDRGWGADRPVTAEDFVAVLTRYRPPKMIAPAGSTGPAPVMARLGRIESRFLAYRDLPAGDEPLGALATPPPPR